MSSSPFATVLGTNYAPSSVELSQLNDLLIEPQQELDRLGSEIARAQAILDDLLSKQQKVQKYFEAHRALMSPIRQLPSETLAEIFQWCLPASDVGYGARSLAHAPLLLTTICRDWRRVSMETPRLWSSLHIFFPPYLEKGVRSRRIAGIELWLQRSGRLPLSISLHGSSVHGRRPLPPPDLLQHQLSEGENIMMPLMNTLLSFRDRIQHIHFALNSTDLIAFRELLVSSGSSLTSLLSFKLDDFRAQGIISSSAQLGLTAINYEPLRTLLSLMPALQNLDIRKIQGRGDSHFHTFHNRWDMLTDLSILQPLVPADLFTILTKSRALKTLAAVITVSGAFDPTALTQVTLMNLTSLRLGIQVYLNLGHGLYTLTREEVDVEQDRQIACISAITSRITCPQLKALYLSWDGLFAPLSRAPIIHFPVQALETLGLEIPMTSEAFTECLSLVPALVSLDFVDAGDMFRGEGASTLRDQHFSILTPSADDPIPVCPQLRHLRIINHAANSRYLSAGWSPRALVQFITARAMVNTLDCCDLFSTSPLLLSDEESRSLRAVKEDGKCKLRLHENKPLQTQYVDEPMSGLVNQTRHRRLRRKLADILDNYIESDARVII
ncbi:hypothetical protein D9757_007487 [Collybiopsis confluens]|uniref:F-box domain-containing protein n=1 Tax=Collybiopsis confluens TaxID=2823264 RepID=A0A8H5HK45_9AGAR|nr:hypothetical protein D9757_007487 [Collybiopsis confluens]